MTLTFEMSRIYCTVNYRLLSYCRLFSKGVSILLDFWFSAKSVCPVFFASKLTLLCTVFIYYIEMSLKCVLNEHLLVAKDCMMKILTADFSE